MKPFNYDSRLMALEGAGVLRGGSSGGSGSGDGVGEAITLAEVDRRIQAGVAGALENFKKNGLAPMFDERLKSVNESMATMAAGIEKLTSTPGSSSSSSSGGQQASTPQDNARIKALEETLRQTSSKISALETSKKEAEERAEKTERHGIIQGALSGMPFINEAAGKTAFGIVEPYVKRLDDGSLVGSIQGGGDFPVDVFVKDYIKKDHDYLLRPTGSAGSGAPGGGGQRFAGGSYVDINDIKTGMAADKRAAAVQQIASVLNAQ